MSGRRFGDEPRWKQNGGGRPVDPLRIARQSAGVSGLTDAHGNPIGSLNKGSGVVEIPLPYVCVETVKMLCSLPDIREHLDDILTEWVAENPDAEYTSGQQLMVDTMTALAEWQVASRELKARAEVDDDDGDSEDSGGDAGGVG